MASLSDRDRKVVWHPYTQHGLGLPLLPVVRAEGAWLHLEDGRRILDAISSWWVNLHGHGHPALARALAGQARELDHVLRAGATHEPAVLLAETLVAAVQARGTSLSRVFYSDDGSTAVEVALKMAWQWGLQTGRTPSRFLALEGGYHGDTLGAMAVGAHSGMHEPFAPLLPPVDFVPPGDVPALEAALAAGGHAAMILEPMVQGTAGMRMHSADYLRDVQRLCRQHGVLLILDEVFSGFYRTGPCFAFEHAGVSPDLLCLSKGLTGGTLPLAVTLSTESVYEAFLSTDRRRAFLHGHSYTGNPIGCAVALASWALLHEAGAAEARERIASRTRAHVAQLGGRSLGTIGAVDLTAGDYFSDLALRLQRAALERGVLLRPLGPVLYSVPPYCTTEAEVDLIYEVVAALRGQL